MNATRFPDIVRTERGARAMGHSRLDTFVAPRPNRLLIKAMSPVNRLVMLGGMPGLRDVPLLDRLPVIRGLADIRKFEFPPADRARLAAVCNGKYVTFITPNHPEFFTDWMIDKHLAATFCPMVASWATNGVVNGLGRLAQRFWLGNNLIAQIPGNSEPARDHSVAWAMTGQGVLLHPEGSVGWHGDWVAPLMPGAAEMAREALDLGGAGRKVWIAPVVWKLAFMRDVEPGLAAECAYVERKLAISPPSGGANPAERVYGIYGALLARDERAAGLSVSADSYGDRQERLLVVLRQRLSKRLPEHRPSDETELLRAARRFLRESRAVAPRQIRAEIRSAIEAIQRVRRVGPFAWADRAMTQERVAEHLKRIRNDYCKGTLRDTMNRYIPRPVGPRRAHLRVPEPLALHDFTGSAHEAMAEIRSRMQDALDGINIVLKASGSLRTYPNPFYDR